MQLPLETISAQELKDHPSVNYQTIYPDEAVPKPRFPLISGPHRKYVRFRESFVLEIPDSLVVGRDGYVIFEGKKVINETTRVWHHFSKHELFQKGVTAEVRVVDEVVAVIAASASQCFTHWMLHILPRLKLIQQSGLKYDRLYVPWLVHPFQKYTLKLLGIDESIFIQAIGSTCIKAKKLIVPSLIDGVAEVRPQWACQFIIDSFGPKPQRVSNRTKRIFLARKTSTTEGYRRYVVNEKELMEYLEPHGFERVVLEDYSVSEQAQLFADSEMIVAAHGAALTHTIFCKKGTKVVEIFMQRHLCPSYFCLSTTAGNDHRCILSADELLTEEQQATGDIHIPIDRLSLELGLPAPQKEPV